MNQQLWTDVDRYFEDRLVPRDTVLESALRSSDAGGLPPHNVAPNQGKLLMMLALIHGARRILEIGTLGGYSTIWLARALPKGGQLMTLEAEARHADVAHANIAGAGLEDLVELHVGPASDTLERLHKEGTAPFDLVFIDADKPSNPDYWQWALKLTRRGGLIIADNVVRDGAVIDADSNDPKVRGIRQFLDLVAAEPRVTATALQTVGAKGYDGFAMALVTGD